MRKLHSVAKKVWSFGENIQIISIDPREITGWLCPYSFSSWALLRSWFSSKSPNVWPENSIWSWCERILIIFIISRLKPLSFSSIFQSIGSNSLPIYLFNRLTSWYRKGKFFTKLMAEDKDFSLMSGSTEWIWNVDFKICLLACSVQRERACSRS